MIQRSPNIHTTNVAYRLFRAFRALYNASQRLYNKKERPVELVTIKQYADSQNVTYEAVRKQIVGYGEELKDHIIRKGRTQYLDEWAVEFLTARRRENPIILLSRDKDEEIEDLRTQVESLQAQLMTAQNELLKAKDQIINLHVEAKELQEDKAKYTMLLNDNKAKEEQLKELTRERDEAQKEAQSFRKSIFGFYRKG